MASDRVVQRLAAILAANMAAYSRLMEVDETGTITRQRSHRNQLVDPAIAVCRERVVNSTGDGVLVEFASVVDSRNADLKITYINELLPRRNSQTSV